MNQTSPRVTRDNAFVGNSPLHGHRAGHPRHLCQAQSVTRRVLSTTARPDVISLTEVIGHQILILQGVLGTDSDDGLVRPKRGIDLLACGLPPAHFLLEHVEQGHDIAETAVRRGPSSGVRMK